MSFYIEYPDDWIGVPAFGPGETFATPEAWAAALVAEIAPTMRPKPRRAQRAALAQVLAFVAGNVERIGADSGYVWLDPVDSSPFLVGAKVLSRLDVGDATPAQLAGAAEDSDFVPPIERELVTGPGVRGHYVERHAPLDDEAVHVGNLSGTYVLEADGELLLLGTATTDFAAYERFRPHFEEFAGSVRHEA